VSDFLARIALLFGLLADGAAEAADGSAPAWSRHCVLPKGAVRDDADRSQLQEKVARCTAHDACTLACRASSCAYRVEKSCEADCRREDPLVMSRLADRWQERICGGSSEYTEAIAWDARRADAALAAGLGELATTVLPAGMTEVRIWASSGAFVRQPMLRLRRSARGVVTGDLYIRYSVDWAIDGKADGRDLRRFMRTHCHSISVGADEAMCHARFAREPRWDALYRRFEALGLLTLPDQEDLPRPVSAQGGANCTAVADGPCELDYIVITDGSGMHVEVRQGSAYRTYDYDSNGAQGREPAKVDAAFEILNTVLGLHWGFDER
jgi:hypothetical protein